MKQVKKKRLTGKQILLTVTLSVVILLSVLTAVLTSLRLGEPGGGEQPTPPEIFDGEAIYLNSPIAYPQVSESKMNYILVKNKTGTFDLTRPDKNGAFWLGYDIGYGVQNMMLYAPPIMEVEGDFDYQSLYATVDSGYGSIYMLTYLCSAIGTPYFNERIVLPDPDTAKDEQERERLTSEREALLSEYGFGAESTTVSFAYTDTDESGAETSKTHSVTIGGRAVSDSGYYFMVDGRKNYVYYTASSYFDYALSGFHTFVKGMLVSEGIASDSAYEPYLTTDFREWKSEMHKIDGEQVTAGSLAIAGGTVIELLNASRDYVPVEGERTDGYTEGALGQISFDLEKLAAHHDFKRIESTLTSLKVGALDQSVTVTLTSSDAENTDKLLDLSSIPSVLYQYTVYSIESVLTDTYESAVPGELVGERNLVKIAYNVAVGGTEKSSILRHAIIDLESPLLSPECVSAFRSSAVGTLPSPIRFDINYSKDNSYKVTESFVISDIVKIYDAEGKAAAAVTETSYVTVKYHEIINGVKGDTGTLALSLSDMSSFKNGDKIKAALIGRGVSSNINLVAYESESHYELLRDFIAYKINNIEYFVTSKLVVSFKFVNASERDPYYGESFYENTLKNEYSFYGLNAGACEKVVEFLGGVGTNGTVSSSGLSGTTVAIGLTHENMEKYGLYNYKIYFELPRGITDVTEGTEFDDSSLLSDYDWVSTLGFNLYISDKRFDREKNAWYRNVGSDMYDLIARVYGEEFDFLEYDFIDFYARRTLLMVDIDNVDKIEMNFGMTDVYGSYTFDVNTTKKYIGMNSSGQTVAADEYFEGSTPASLHTVSITAKGDRIETEFEKILRNESTTGRVSVTRLYNVVNNGGKDMGTQGLNTVGVSNFKDVFEITQLMAYEGAIHNLSDEERARAEASKSDAPELTMRVKLTDSSYYYSYEFRRFDDRRVMVTLFRSDADGNAVTAETSDFYISTFAMKKLVRSYVDLLDGKYIKTDDGYGG